MKKIFISCLGDSIDRYLKLKEALGRRFAIERRVLEQLDDFMIEAGASMTGAGLSFISRRASGVIGCASCATFVSIANGPAQTALSRTPICFRHDT
jgi:hypothetical protein